MAAGTIVAQNRKPKKSKLETPKSERSVMQDQRIAQKRAEKAATLNKENKEQTSTHLSAWDQQQISRKQDAKAEKRKSGTSHSMKAEIAPSSNN